MSETIYNWDEKSIPYSSRMGKYKTDTEYDFILKNIAKYPPTSTILDIGGGSGRFSSKLKNRGYDCLIVDPDENAVSIAKEKGLNAEKNDFLNLTLHQYDIVLAIEVLLYIENKTLFFDKIIKHLKKDGIFIFTATNPRSWRYLLRNLSKPN